EVPPAYEGQGIAARLAHAALEYAKEQGLKVNPVCPYVKAYLRKHPEYQSIVWGS
ncbi:MAG: N-acetyltransferase, partial [Gammaproteobacteria bacterium]|nr:N-acetyltransferase [Anaerolineae bacterium]MCB1743522.1 N-acetyltransferase [Gammaproteobacteria bacterium]